MARLTDPMLRTYLRDIESTALLSAEEEVALSIRLKAGDASARDHLVRANLRLVVAVAREFEGRGLSTLDLIEEGNVGLLRAVELFDPTKSRLATYASIWIRQSMRRAIIANARTIRVPSRVIQLLARYRRTFVEMCGELGRDPSHEEITARLALPAGQLDLLLSAMHTQNVLSGDETPETSAAWFPDLEDESASHPAEEAERLEEVENLLAQMSGVLSDRELAVVRRRYGIGGGEAEPVQLRELAEELQLSRERVRQIENEAIRKLCRAMLGNSPQT